MLSYYPPFICGLLFWHTLQFSKCIKNTFDVWTRQLSAVRRVSQRMRQTRSLEPPEATSGSAHSCFPNAFIHGLHYRHRLQFTKCVKKTHLAYYYKHFLHCQTQYMLFNVLYCGGHIHISNVVLFK